MDCDIFKCKGTAKNRHSALKFLKNWSDIVKYVKIIAPRAKSAAARCSNRREEICGEADRGNDYRHQRERQRQRYHQRSLPDCCPPLFVVELMVVVKEEWNHQRRRQVVGENSSAYDAKRDEGDDYRHDLHLTADVDVGDKGFGQVEPRFSVNNACGKDKEHILEDDCGGGIRFEPTAADFEHFHHVGKDFVSYVGRGFSNLEFLVNVLRGEFEAEDLTFDDEEQRQHDEHLERGKIAQIMSVEIVANHIPRAGKELGHRAEHGAAAETPNLEEAEDDVFEGEAFAGGGFAALGAEAALKLLAAVTANVLGWVDVDDWPCDVGALPPVDPTGKQAEFNVISL